MSKLEESNLFNTLIGGINETIVYTNPETGISQNIEIWKHKDFPEAFSYITDTLNTFIQLETVIESLLLAEKLINNVEKINKTTKIANSDLLKYFLKNWVGNYVTTYEVVLQLINVIFELGYIKRQASKTNIEQNDIFKTNELLYDLTKPICDLVWSDMQNSGKILESNNKIKHKGVFNHKEIDELNTTEMWRRFGIREDTDLDFEIDKGLIKLSILKDVKKKNYKIIEEILVLSEYFNEVFEEKFLEKRKR